MAVRVLSSWGALLARAVANGARRELWLTRRPGANAGHRASAVMLSGLILLPAWSIGYLFGRSRLFLLADYNTLAGRIWPLVLVVTLVAPWIAFIVQGR